MNQELNRTTKDKRPYYSLSLAGLFAFCLFFIGFGLFIWLSALDIDKKSPAAFSALIAVSLLCLPISTLLSIASLWIIKKSLYRFKGMELSTTITILSILAGLHVFTLPAQGRIKPIAQRVVCGTNLKALGTAIPF